VNSWIRVLVMKRIFQLFTLYLSTFYPLILRGMGKSLSARNLCAAAHCVDCC
jgi:hypothetical protein